MINEDYLEQLSGIADMLDMIGAKKEAGVIDRFIKKIAEGEIVVDPAQEKAVDVPVAGGIDVKKSLEESDQGYFQKCLTQRTPGPNAAGSTFESPMTKEDIINADWKPSDDPSIKAPAKGFVADIPGLLGVAEIENVNDDTPVVFRKAHAGVGAGSGVGQNIPFDPANVTEVVAVLDNDERHVDFTTLILGPKESGDGFELWTFFPGGALKSDGFVNIEDLKKEFNTTEENIPATAADAKRLGFNIVKHVPQLPQG